MAKQPEALDAPPCQTDEMKLIHGLFRSLFRDAPALVRGVAASRRGTGIVPPSSPSTFWR